MATSEPLIHWPDPIFELVGFVAVFLAAGAVGFRAIVLRRVSKRAPADEARVLARAGARAAAFGLAGSAVALALRVNDLPGLAARRHVTVAQLLSGSPQTGLQVLLAVLEVLGFTLAVAGRGSGWWLAGLGAIGGPIVPLFFGQWQRLVNPVHELAGGLWIGTLFTMVAAGFALVLRSGLAPERRGRLVADMVNAFSPWALGFAGLLMTMGVITAWLHLKRWSTLWTTAYGGTLIAKLCVVAAVAGLGAWNWRRQRPRLGSEAGALAIHGSARAELAVAGVVLVVTAILVSLPSPR